MGTYYPIPEPAPIAALESDVAHLKEAIPMLVVTLESVTSAAERQDAVIRHLNDRYANLPVANVVNNNLRPINERLDKLEKLVAKQQQTIEDLVGGVSELSGASAAHTDALRELRTNTAGFNLLGSAVTSPSASEGKRTSSRTKS